MKYVVHSRRAKFDVYIGRPGPWGNPFMIGRDGSRAEVVSKYQAWLDTRPDLKARAKIDLRGKVLGCFCSPLACHGDILSKVANES